MDAGDDGNLVATQRILSLVDEGSFIETEAYVRHRSVLGLSLIHI